MKDLVNFEDRYGLHCTLAMSNQQVQHPITIKVSYRGTCQSKCNYEPKRKMQLNSD